MAYHWATTSDGSSRYPWVDSGCVDLLGLEPAELSADSGQFWRLVHPDDRTPLKLAKLHAQRLGTRLRHICRITTVSGEAKLIEIVAYPLPPAGALWSAVALDISEGQRRLEELQQLQQSLDHQHQQTYQLARSLAEAHAALARISTVDAPTGLPNRLHFEHSLMRAVAQAQRHGLPLTLVLLKLQGLRQCNARDGFLSGDRALQAFAALLGLSLGHGETAGRIGSVDFAVLLPQRDLAGGQLWLAALQARVDASEALPRQTAGHSA